MRLHESLLFNKKVGKHWQHLRLQRDLHIYQIVQKIWIPEPESFPFYASCREQTQCIINDPDIAL